MAGIAGVLAAKTEPLEDKFKGHELYGVDAVELFVVAGGGWRAQDGRAELFVARPNIADPGRIECASSQ